MCRYADVRVCACLHMHTFHESIFAYFLRIDAYFVFAFICARTCMCVRNATFLQRFVNTQNKAAEANTPFAIRAQIDTDNIRLSTVYSTIPSLVTFVLGGTHQENRTFIASKAAHLRSDGFIEANPATPEPTIRSRDNSHLSKPICQGGESLFLRAKSVAKIEEIGK